MLKSICIAHVPVLLRYCIKLSLVVLVIQLTVGILQGQSDLRFKHLTSQNGLTSNHTRCLVKDKLGFLWIGTDEGLNRFDGSTVIPYSHIIGDTNSLINNNINALFVDEKNHIWIGTDLGLSIFFPETSQFYNYRKVPTSNSSLYFYLGRVMSIGQFANKIWVITYCRIFSTPKDSFQFEFPNDSIFSTHITQNDCTGGAYGMLATPSSLHFLTEEGPVSSQDGKTYHYLLNHSQPLLSKPKFALTSNTSWVTAIVNDGDSLLYFTKEKIPYLFIYNTKRPVLDSIPFQTAIDLEGIYVTSLCNLKKGEIWGTTNKKGVFKVNTSLRKTTFYLKDPNNPHSLSDNNCRQLVIDKEGTLFIATLNGVDYLSPPELPFTAFSLANSELVSESPNITEDADCKLWLGSYSKGLFSLNPADHTIEHFELPGDFNKIHTLCAIGNEILFASDAGIGSFSSQSKSFRSMMIGFPIGLQNLLKAKVLFMFKGNNDFLWIGFDQEGILKLNIRTGEFIRILQPSIFEIDKSHISTYTLDDENNLWVAFLPYKITKINLYDNSIQEFYLPLRNGNEPIGSIQSIKRDHQDNLWIAMRQAGVYKYHIPSRTFTTYDTRNGLSTNILSSMVIDNEDQIWISADNGLNKLDPLTEICTIYDDFDNLPFTANSVSPMYQSKDGSIYIQSTSSITRISPKELNPNPYLPTLVLTSYSKSGEKFILNSQEKCLYFSDKDKIIDFEFLGINFIDPSKTQFAYLLEGFDDDWNLVGNQTHVTFTSLPPRDYTLRIKATNKSGMWDVPENSVKFYVSIPFWRTWWFFLTLFSGFIMLMMYLINLNRIHQLKHIQSIRNKISKDLHDDIGSTLSSISINSTAAGKMKEEQYEETQTILFHIGESSRSAMENMSDIVWAINPSNDTFKNMIDRLAAFGYRILEARNIKLIIDIPESVQALKLDMQMRKNIYLILREAIHNAAKYSQATQCLLTAMVLDKKIDIQISDDGIGFDTLIPRPGGNGLTNMKHRAVEMNAEFSIHSEKENGTCLSLQFNYQ